VPTGYSKSPLLLKGAFLQVKDSLLGPVPQLIEFQYNPETLGRKMQPWQPEQADDGQGGQTAGQAQPFDPQESIDLTLILDASDALEDPDNHPVEATAGVAGRLSALELLLYPTSEEGDLLGDVASSLTGESEVVPRGEVPVVLFSWGPGRIVPVRLTSFSVDEKAFSPTLYPIRAEVSVALKVLTDAAFPEPRTPAEELAVAAYEYTRKQRDLLAGASVVDSLDALVSLS
jgi:hypothetical protein